MPVLYGLYMVCDTKNTRMIIEPTKYWILCGKDPKKGENQIMQEDDLDNSSMRDRSRFPRERNTGGETRKAKQSPKWNNH